MLIKEVSPLFEFLTQVVDFLAEALQRGHGSCCAANLLGCCTAWLLSSNGLMIHGLLEGILVGRQHLLSLKPSVCSLSEEFVKAGKSALRSSVEASSLTRGDHPLEVLHLVHRPQY